MRKLSSSALAVLGFFYSPVSSLSGVTCKTRKTDHFTQNLHNASNPEKQASHFGRNCSTIHTMKPEWQECFRPGPDRDRRRKLCISLNARGDIAINAAAWHEMNRPWFAVLLFDKEGNRIGLKPAKPGEQNAFPMRFTRSPEAKVIRAARLMKQFGLRLTETVRFPDLRQENGVWVLDLNTAVVPDKVRKHWRNSEQWTVGGRR